MKAPTLISKPTLAVIKAALADICTHAAMQNLFDQYAFEGRPLAAFTNKMGRAGAHLDHQNWTSAEVVERLLNLLEQCFAPIVSASSDAFTRNDPCQRIIKALAASDGIVWDGHRFVNRGSAALQHVAQKSSEFNVDAIKREVQRVLESVESDPDDAITAAKSLVEATCRAILEDFGETPPNGTELGPLTKQTLKHLQLLPDQISDAAKGAESAKKVLHSMGTAIQGLGELRNLYGDAHGKGPGARGLDPRHARLAATFAGALATFLLETHRHRRPST